MFMKKKLCLILLTFIIFFLSYLPSEAAKVKKKKIEFNQLTNIDAYQLGMDEFVIKLYGKNLPTPSLEIYENSLEIIIPNTQAKNPKKINNLMDMFFKDSVPAIAYFNLKNVSDDEEYRTVVRFDANREMECNAGTRNSDGYSLRIKILEEEKMNFEKLEPQSKLPNQPEPFLPFSLPEKVNMEFRDADLKDVFRLLMEGSGKNVIIDPSFPQNIVIGLSLVDVKIEEILNYLMTQYDIACCIAGNNTIAFGTRDSLYKLSGNKEIKSFKIAYADLAQLGTMLKNLATLTDAEYAQDDRMRTIHINTNPAKMRVVEDIVKRLDVPSRQVMIRATIFEFNDSATLDVQAAIEAVYDKWTFTSDPYNSPGVIKFLDETYKNGKSNFDRTITATLKALETKRKGKTIANPSVIAVDGQEASISLKQDVLYMKGTDDDGHPEWDTVEVGPELKFTPRIEENGYIYLTIDISTGDYLGKDNDENIQTTERKVTTKIRVRDGMPFVVGGLHQDNHIKTESKVPILGNIPLLGELFKYTNDEHEKTEAVMIVTPYILN